MSNKRLIVAEEVIDIAFSKTDQIEASSISVSKIESAELKFIAPLFGGLYGRMTEGRYDKFVEEYIKEPLAYFVKYLLIPEISVKIGNMGVVKNRDINSNAASRADLEIIRRDSKSMGNTLLKKAISYIEQNLESFPEYESTKDMRNRVVIRGGIIL